MMDALSDGATVSIGHPYLRSSCRENELLDSESHSHAMGISNLRTILATIVHVVQYHRHRAVLLQPGPAIW